MNHITPSFRKRNLQNIKGIFEEKTGIALASQNTTRRPVKAAVLLAAILACFLSLSAFAMNLFSSLSGDDLSLAATYQQNGIVSVAIENRSDKDLVFQPKLKLMLWNTSEEIRPISNDIPFKGTKVTAHSSETMTIDLSKAYDIKTLEEALTENHYYFILTNNNFIFGQDWMCTVKFSDTVVRTEAPLPAVQSDETSLQAVPRELQPYFKDITFDINERRALNAHYVQSYKKLFEQSDKNIVSSVSPLSLLVDTPSDIIFDNTVSKEEQHLLVGEHWLSSDANFKLLATETETALTISALLPSANDTDSDTGTNLPLFYVFTYEKEKIGAENDYAFIHGQMLRFSDLEKYKVYEDKKYICYEVSSFIYSDLTEYIQNFIAQNPDIRYDEQSKKRVQTIYNYYKEHLSSSFFTR